MISTYSIVMITNKINTHVFMCLWGRICDDSSVIQGMCHCVLTQYNNITAGSCYCYYYYCYGVGRYKVMQAFKSHDQLTGCVPAHHSNVRNVRLSVRVTHVLSWFGQWLLASCSIPGRVSVRSCFRSSTMVTDFLETRIHWSTRRFRLYQ